MKGADVGTRSDHGDDDSDEELDSKDWTPSCHHPRGSGDVRQLRVSLSYNLPTGLIHFVLSLESESPRDRIISASRDRAERSLACESTEPWECWESSASFC